MTYTHPPFTAALRSIDLYPGHSVHTATGTLYPDVLAATRRNGRAIVQKPVFAAFTIVNTMCAGGRSADTIVSPGPAPGWAERVRRSRDVAGV